MSDDCSTCLVYASLDDFKSCGLPAAALANVSLKDQQLALMRASRMADTFIRDRYHLPMKCPIDPALTMWVCWIAVYMCLSFRGFNPNSGIDQIVRMNYDDSINALKRVANGQQQLCVRQAAPSSTQPQMSSSPSRGFSTPSGEDLPIVGPNTWGN